MKENQTLNSPSNKLPTHAQVVIIGGGVIGCSVAYHLTKLGWRDVVLLERKDLTCGTTWHAAGLAESGLFASAVKSDMAKYTQELFQRLGEETGQDTGFRRVGFLELASSAEWVEGLRRVADFGRYNGHVIEELSPSEIVNSWPLLKTDDLLAGFFCPDAARVTPVDATMAEDDVPEQWELFKEINRVYFEDGHEAGETMVAAFLESKA